MKLDKAYLLFGVSVGIVVSGYCADEERYSDSRECLVECLSLFFDEIAYAGSSAYDMKVRQAGDLPEKYERETGNSFPLKSGDHFLLREGESLTLRASGTERLVRLGALASTNAIGVLGGNVCTEMQGLALEVEADSGHWIVFGDDNKAYDVLGKTVMPVKFPFVGIWPNENLRMEAMVRHRLLDCAERERRKWVEFRDAAVADFSGNADFRVAIGATGTCHVVVEGCREPADSSRVARSNAWVGITKIVLEIDGIADKRGVTGIAVLKGRDERIKRFARFDLDGGLRTCAETIAAEGKTTLTAFVLDAKGAMLRGWCDAVMSQLLEKSSSGYAFSGNVDAVRLFVREIDSTFATLSRIMVK